MDESTTMPLQNESYSSPNKVNPRMRNQEPTWQQNYGAPQSRNLTPRQYNQPQYNNYDYDRYPDPGLYPEKVNPYEKSFRPDFNDENTPRAHNRNTWLGSNSGKKPKIKLSNKKSNQQKGQDRENQWSNKSKMSKPQKAMDLSKPEDKSEYAVYSQDTPTETKQYNRPGIYSQPVQTVYYPAVQVQPNQVRYFDSNYQSPVVYRATPTPERRVMVQADPKPFLPTQTIVRRAPLQELPGSINYNPQSFPQTNVELQISHDPDEELDIELVTKEANVPIRFKINPSNQQPSDYSNTNPQNFSSRGFYSGQTPFR